jgi:heme-degrading monooxygenase HmoA
MIVVIFELICREGKTPHYLDLAAELKPLLQDIDGFISIERFRSLNDDNKLLSLSCWRDEQAVMQWRNLMQHRLAQKLGRDDIFADYRLRVASVMRDYGLDDRADAPHDSKQFLSV